MVIKNKSNRIIHIQNTAIMPDDSIPVSEETAKLPAISAFIRLGFVELDDTEERIAKAAKKAAAEQASKEASEAQDASKDSDEANKKAAKEDAEAEAAKKAAAKAAREAAKANK